MARTPIAPTEAHVLVVEDNVPNFVLIARMLAFMGVQRCEWKTSGWQVVQFAETGLSWEECMQKFEDQIVDAF